MRVMWSKNKKGLFCLTLLCSAFVATILGTKLSSPNHITPVYVPTENFLVSYAEIKEEDKPNILIVTSKNPLPQSYGATKIISAPNDQYFLQFNSEAEKDRALSVLKTQPEIIAEENIVRYISEDSAILGTYNSWGVSKMGLDHVVSELSSVNKEEIIVAIVDTGLDVDLFNQNYPGRLATPVNIIDSNSEEMYDNVGHGTHIAGTIAEATSPNVKIMPIKITDSESMYNSDIITAFNYISASNNINVVNMSFGSPSSSLSEYNALKAFTDKNIIGVAAAGNDHTVDANFPASYPDVISVSSVDSNLAYSSFTNHNYDVIFSAPGGSILSINGTKSGTSMASPHIAATVALLKSLNKNLTYTNVVDLLKNHTLDLGEEGYDEFYGYGFIYLGDADFCKANVTCDEYGVFSENTNTPDILRITLNSQNTYYSVPYNYGSNLNLFPLELKMYYTPTQYYVNTLGNIWHSTTISNYDPTVINGVTMLSLDYLGYSVNIPVSTPNTRGWDYTENSDGSITLTNFIKDDTTSTLVIEIPDHYRGYPVTKLGNNLFRNQTNIREVIIPSSIASIGDNAFYGLNRLFSIHLPEGLTNIGSEAFSNTALLSVNIPSTVTSMGLDPFLTYAVLGTIEIMPSDLTLWVHHDTYGESKAISYNNSLRVNYLYIEPSNINITSSKTNYTALDQVNKSDININLQYTGTKEFNEDINNFHITYQNGNHFNYGDTAFIVSFYTMNGYYIEREIPVSVSKINLPATDNTVDQTIKQDGNPHGLELNITKDSQVIVKFADSNDEYILDDSPTYTEPGTYTIKYKLFIDNNYTEIYGEHTLTIESFLQTPSYVINNNNFVLKDLATSIDQAVEALENYTGLSLNSHANADGSPAESNKLKTGDILKFTTNTGTIDYTVIVKGDVDGDGGIGIIDYIRIKKDIMDTTKLSGIYFAAADMNENDTIDIIDYIRIRKKIMEE